MPMKMKLHVLWRLVIHNDLKMPSPFMAFSKAFFSGFGYSDETLSLVFYITSNTQYTGATHCNALKKIKDKITKRSAKQVIKSVNDETEN